MRRVVAAVALALASLSAGAGAAPADAGPDMRRILADEPAPRLADYRLFLDAAAHTPARGVIDYDLATPLFSDYAQKSRLVFVPDGAAARYVASGVFEFPVGSVLIKTFAYPADLRAPSDSVRRLETRLLIRKASGWSAQTYVWNAAGTEARLLEVGAQIPVTFIDLAGTTQSFVYDVPNRNQCKGCHVHDGAITPIGPRARNLDRMIATDAGAENQINRWSRLGVLSGAPRAASEAPDAFDAASASLDVRARAYLDVNCAHCHSPGGPADNSGLDLRFEQTTPILFGVRKRPVAAGRASADLSYAIDPGHPDRSILLHRMESDDSGVMMPELGRTLVHREGVALVRDWIAAMDESGHARNTNGGTP